MLEIDRDAVRTLHDPSMSIGTVQLNNVTLYVSAERFDELADFQTRPD